uniref:Probable proton-coupled zinc antiporter SLC30A3 n=1 Tax=Salarias fasciatus TaxID=181472 RepID=A0A672I9W1_SALFA
LSVLQKQHFFNHPVSFADSQQQQYAGLTLKNGALELKRAVEPHCHGPRAAAAAAAEQSRDKLLAQRKLYIASAVCLVFMVGEVVEILGALVSVMSIWVVTGALVYLAVERIVRNDYEIDGHVMLVTSGCAVIVNIIMAYILHHSTTFHAHGSGYHVRAAFIHVVGDLLQSVGVMVAAAIIYFRPEYKVADPVCTFLFSVFVLCTTVTILRDVFRILMEGSPRGIEFNSVKEVLLSVRDVKSMHCLHLWSLSLSQPMVSVHLAIDSGSDPQSVLQEASDLLHSKFGFYSATIQVEQFTDDMRHCPRCQDPRD